jgi:FtsP/CotA-like multicopper oxidase with cupredoxin domain
MRSERKMKRTLLSSLFLGPALLLAALLAPGTVAAAGPITSTACVDGVTPNTVTCNLWAKPGSVTLPTTTGTVSVPVWGFAATAGGPAIVPGPVLVADQGDTVTVNLTNNLVLPGNPPVPTSILFGGQALAPDITGVAVNGTKTYTFVAGAPGTYLYEAGLIPGSQYQVAMGLYGALIVRPTGLPGQAYGDPATAFNDEALVILGEIDPTLNNSATPWTVDLRAFAPRYFLVNGAPYTSAAPSITTTPGAKLLLRYANAGIQHHSIGVLGLHQAVLAADGSQLPYPRTMVAETIAPGQSADVLVTMPAPTAASTKYALYDASMTLNNSSASGIGGMLAFIDAIGTAGADTVGPITSSVALNTTSGVLTASVSDATTGGANVTAAEYFIDTPGPAGTGVVMTGTFGTSTVSVTAPPVPLASGSHTIYVRGRDSVTPVPNWGAFSSVSYSIDAAGPITSALVLNPNPSNGTVSVALTGTASDAATGNGNVTAAEYFLGAPGANGTGVTVARNLTAATVSLSATIPAGPGGVISVHARDAAGNWGPFATITRVVDGTGPTTSSIVANPAANNGSLGQSSSNPTVRVTASFSDVASGGSTIATGEGFIDNALGANGTGFPFSAADGVFNTVAESGYADIPLTTINLLSSGNHTIHVHGKDSVGNWGAKTSITYLIDRTAPTFTSISLAPNPTLGAASVTMTVNGASDPLVSGLASGVAGGEYWIDTAAPAPGSGTPFNGTSASIPVGALATGNHTVGVRIRDVAGNWSAGTSSATVQVVPDAIFSNGFDTGGAPWGWTSRSTTSTARLNVTTSPALVGARSLQAQGNNNPNYVQFNFGTTANPVSSTYDARFYFRPNGNTSTGKDILSAATSNTFGTIDFRVRYRLNAGTPQVQIQVGTANTNPTWTTILGGTSNNVIEVTWQAGGTLRLFVNGTLSQTLTAGAGSVGAVRLGSVTATGNATLMYFDAFASKRSVSPLVGP